MKYLSKEAYKQELSKAQKYSKQKAMRQQIHEAGSAWKTEKLKMETSKKLAIYLFVLMNVIVVYCLVAMWAFGDLSCLSVLITDIAAQILIYGIYCLKAYKAKKSAEDVALKRERMNGLGDLLESGAESQEHVPVNSDVTEFNSGEV